MKLDENKKPFLAFPTQYDMVLFSLSIPENNPLRVYAGEGCSSMFTRPADCLYQSETVMRYDAWGRVGVAPSLYLHAPFRYIPEFTHQRGMLKISVAEIQAKLASVLNLKPESPDTTVSFPILVLHLEKLLRSVFLVESKRNAWSLLTDLIDCEIFKQLSRAS